MTMNGLLHNYLRRRRRQINETISIYFSVVVISNPIHVISQVIVVIKQDNNIF